MGSKLLSTTARASPRFPAALVVLDTHAWIWWLTKPDRLGKAARRSIEKASRIGIPAICPWEVATKGEAGRLRFDRPYELWIDQALTGDRRVEVLALSPQIALAAAKLSWLHGDPADRMIVATARVYEAPLVTSDERIHDASLVRCVWD